MGTDDLIKIGDEIAKLTHPGFEAGWKAVCEYKESLLRLSIMAVNLEHPGQCTAAVATAQNILSDLTLVERRVDALKRKQKEINEKIERKEKADAEI